MATPVIRSGYGFVAPALILLIAMNIFPLLYSIYLSFTNAELTGGALADVGGRNYDIVFRASKFADALRTTAAFVASAVGIELVLGFALALALHAVGLELSVDICCIAQGSDFAVQVAGSAVDRWVPMDTYNDASPTDPFRTSSF